MIKCYARKSKVCYICGKPMTSLCDATRKDGRPCDIPMCDEHRNRVGEDLDDVDVCDYHNYPKYIKQATENRKILDDVMVYFYEEYQKQDIRVVAGHWPEFKTKKEVDDWINGLEIHNKMMRELFKD